VIKRSFIISAWRKEDRFNENIKCNVTSIQPTSKIGRKEKQRNWIVIGIAIGIVLIILTTLP